MLAYLAHESRLNRPTDDGSTQRAHLEAALRSKHPRSRATAEAALAGPEYPDGLEYLHEWAAAVHGRSGVSMSGFLPLSWECLDAWARQMRVTLRPHEAAALMRCDAVLLHPPELGDAD